MGHAGGRRGYTLIEALVAGLVFAIGVVGAFGFFTTATILLNVENHRRTAVEMAHSRQEELRTASFGGLPSYQEDSLSVEIDGLPAARSTIVEDVDEDGGGTVDYRRVTVRVTWRENRRDQHVQLVTLRSRYR